jgi:hypothetical protein
MNSKDEVVSFAENCFRFLGAEGFAEPVIKTINWETTLSWLHRDVGIELEIDFRESTLYVLIVRLENGRLPKGYYESDGRTCRVHLGRAIDERGWDADMSAIRAVVASHQAKDKVSGRALLQALMIEYARMLVPRIVAERDLLF